MKHFDDGFYIYTNSNMFDNKKYQTIRGMFESRAGEVYISGFDSIDKNNVLLQDPEPIDVSKITKNNFCDDMDKFSMNCCLAGPMETLKREFIKLNMNIGVAYNGIYRPILNEDVFRLDPEDFVNDRPNLKVYKDLPIGNSQEYFNSLNMLEILLDDLSSIFKVVTPEKANLNSYGHEIRNIIILACTEIDAQMKSCLTKNEVKSSGSYFTTKDYVKLLQPLHLMDYSLSFYRFENIGDFKPYSEWNEKNPTVSLPWYDAYNKIKHDRETYFPLANLANAINSIMALAIILITQYGYRNNYWNEKVGRILHVKSEPIWNIKDFYVPAKENCKQQSINYPFD